MKCMSVGRDLYRIHDKDTSLGCHRVSSLDEASRWSQQGWGIFWTVNRFDGPRRKENCKEVLAWAVDLDAGTKKEQIERIRSVPLSPSAVVETARGFHVYFDARGEADPENYRDIAERLVDAYNGDKNAKDVCRILRVPGFMHQKGEPFAVKLVAHSSSSYSESEMRKAFPVVAEKETELDHKTELRTQLKVSGSGDLWERVWDLDCEQALIRLSGSGAVCYEMFSFKRTSSGNLNILVNGKGTSCWIDKNKRIGSSDHGGPTIYQWINWYHKDHKKSFQLFKEAFPEVCA